MNDDEVDARVARGSRNEETRQRNLALMLSSVHSRGSLSRAELTRHSGLNRSTVGFLVAELVELGLVLETEPSAERRVGQAQPGCRSQPRCGRDRDQPGCHWPHGRGRRPRRRGSHARDDPHAGDHDARGRRASHERLRRRASPGSFPTRRAWRASASPFPGSSTSAPTRSPSLRTSGGGTRPSRRCSRRSSPYPRGSRTTRLWASWRSLATARASVATTSCTSTVLPPASGAE